MPGGLAPGSPTWTWTPSLLTVPQLGVGVLAQCSSGCHVIERFAHFLVSIHERVALSLMFLTHLNLSQCVDYTIQSVDKVTYLMKNSVLLPGLLNLRQKIQILSSTSSQVT